MFLTLSVAKRKGHKMTAIAMVFSGQGPQYVGMGKSLYDAYPLVQDCFAKAEAITGMELKRLCFEGPMEELTQTANLQPAITVVNMACFLVLKENGITPFAVAGHSLGEITALFACGCLSFEEALGFVKLRGAIMDREANANPGIMKLIMGPKNAEVEAVCAKVKGVVQAANLNTPTQTVITGEEAAVNEAAAILKEQKARIMPLKVSGPWHSPFMQKAEDELKQTIAGMSFAAPVCYMVPNVTGMPTKDPEVIKAELMRQIVRPTNWVDTAKNMWGLGLRVYVQAGPKNALVAMISQSAEQLFPEEKESLLTCNVEDVDTLEKALSALKTV